MLGETTLAICDWPRRHNLPIVKPRRVRDPVHNLVEFNAEQFEHVLWNVIETPQFQRLRRIRQLGFSEFVYPGATHTRFSHSVGVFHTARQLMSVIERYIKANNLYLNEHKKRVALAAALVHDLGHGMFSHSFEEIGTKLNLKFAADHELVSDLLIRDSEVTGAFKEMGSGFANDVADVIHGQGVGTLYDAVVSSQFDADRLDYMQRDRLMTGVQNSGIDVTWLISNLEIGTVPTGVDQEGLKDIETFVLGPKASLAAEMFVLALFQLYPTVYFHKTTRAAEKTFAALMLQAISLVQEGHTDKTGLPAKHPIVQFAQNPENKDALLALDDSVFWGALPLLVEATDGKVSECASHLRLRRLPKCIDIREQLRASISPNPLGSRAEREEIGKKLDRMTASIEEKARDWEEGARGERKGAPRILFDRATRHPYRTFQETKGPLNQIRIRGADGKIRDVAESSPVVAAIEPFSLFRAYVDGNDHDARRKLEQLIEGELKGKLHA